MAVNAVWGFPDQSRVEQLRTFTKGAVGLIAVITLFWHLVYAFLFPVPEKPHVVIHWGLLFSLFYLTHLDFAPEDWRDHLKNATNLVATASVAIVSIYVYTHINPEWLFNAQMLLQYGTTDLAVGAVAILITIHATYLAFGRVLASVGVVALVYAIYGDFFPGLLRHAGIGLERLLFSTTITLGDGVWGYLMDVGATWVVIFILYAGMVEGYGGMEYITKIGRRLGRMVEGGVVQVAVITSFIVGSFMGGSVSNVATTGSFTIPMMKDRGVQPRIAGAIESLASTGGQILPPVMGSAAFIMADILGISYFDVIVGAILPAMLFYLPVVVVVFLSNRRYGWSAEDTAPAQDTTEDHEGEDIDVEIEAVAITGMGNVDHDPRLDEDEIFEQSRLSLLVEGLPYIASFLVLIWALMIEQYDPLYAGAHGVVATMVFAVPQYLSQEGLTLSAIAAYLRATVDGAVHGSMNQAPLTAVLSMLGVVVTILTQSGFTQNFRFYVLTSFAAVGVFLLILVMLMSIIFGLGMPSAPAYIVVAIVSAPVLVNAGMEPLGAHLFVFYFALLSTITPPVALSCAMAAGISGSSFYQVTKETLRLGMYAFIVPFVFVYWPSLVNWDSTTPIAFVVGVIGICTLGFGLVGHNGRRLMPAIERFGFAAVALLLLFGPVAGPRVTLWPLLGLTVLWIAGSIYFPSIKRLLTAQTSGI